MALGSQASTVEAMSDLTGLTHDIFVGSVQNNVRRESPVAMLFQDAGSGDYRLEGQNMVFAVDLEFKTGGIASDGKLPDYVGLDAVQGKITPIRRYERIAMDNFVDKRASGPGAFEDLATRIFDKLWDAWRSMEIRHAIGASSGVICKVDARSSATVFTVKDGYGHADTNPTMHLSVGAIIGWYDVGDTQVGGASKISALDHSTRQVTVASGTNWETDVGNQIAANDLIFFATTTATGNAHFTLERNLAPNGLGTILDPDADLTTVFNIAEGTYERWKPYRKSSTTFDHLELAEHWQQLGAKRGFKVSSETDVVVTFPSAVAQLARSLMGLQQQAYSGQDLQGGYVSVTVNGIPIVEDHFFWHDVAATLCKEKLYRVTLGGDADFYSGDGAMWSRVADYDGQDAYVFEYMNYFSNHRGAHGALTSISTDVTDANWDPVPNY